MESGEIRKRDDGSMFKSCQERTWLNEGDHRPRHVWESPVYARCSSIIHWAPFPSQMWPTSMAKQLVILDSAGSVWLEWEGIPGSWVMRAL